MNRLAPFALGLILVAQASAQETLALVPPPRLVLHLSVDQLRPDYLERWEPEFSGGLAWLLREGVFYVRGQQDHAVTETAPGHASQLSGRWPYSTEVVTNDRGVPDPLSPLIGSNSTGASPRRFKGTTLHDWMRAADPDVRVLSVSRKDRGAILPIGRAAVPVYWYSGGKFTTSRWYGDSLPTWLQQWNASDPIASIKGTAWLPLRPLDSYPEADNRPYEAGGTGVTFPHLIPDDWTMAAAEVANTPVMDSLILAVAWEGVRALKLGTRRGTDLLAISLSTTDAIGHRYGPGSLELHDQILRLDRHLGWFLDSLAKVVPLDQIVVSLTSDHGGHDYPEGTTDGGRIRLTDEARAINRWGVERWAVDLDADEQSGLLLAETDLLRVRGVNVDSIAAAIADRVSKRPGVRRVYTPQSLHHFADLDAMRWRRQLPPSQGWLVAVSLEPGWMWASNKNYTTHGTTNELDVLVPVIIRAPGFQPARVTRPIGVVDIGPTIAALLGISPTEPLDGRLLAEFLRPVR
jgi:predicted AlkP superfamily pyrophosphatase or phosphodiesterase